MTTVVNNPAPAADNGGSFLIGVIVLAGLVLIFVYFGIPAIRRMGPIQIGTPAPQVNIPGKIDVNVNQAK